MKARMPLKVTFRDGRSVVARMDATDWSRERDHHRVWISNAHSVAYACGPIIHQLTGHLTERAELEIGNAYGFTAAYDGGKVKPCQVFLVEKETCDGMPAKLVLQQPVKGRGKPGPKPKAWEDLAESTRRRREREWARIDAESGYDW